MPAARKSRVPSEMRFCDKEGQETEWRKYKRGKRVSTGEIVYQWRCTSCQARSDRLNKSKKGVGIKTFERQAS